MTAKWPKARAKVVEDKANGPAVMDVLDKEIPGMVPYNPRGSKEERAISVTPYFEAGNVFSRIRTRRHGSQTCKKIY